MSDSALSDLLQTICNIHLNKLKPWLPELSQNGCVVDGGTCCWLKLITR